LRRGGSAPTGIARATPRRSELLAIRRDTVRAFVATLVGLVFIVPAIIVGCYFLAIRIGPLAARDRTSGERCAPDVRSSTGNA
jgi:hypothetical protein